MHTEIMREGPPGKTTRVSSPSLLFPTVERDSIQGEKGGEREAFFKTRKKKEVSLPKLDPNVILAPMKLLYIQRRLASAAEYNQFD